MRHLLAPGLWQQGCLAHRGLIMREDAIFINIFVDRKSQTITAKAGSIAREMQKKNIVAKSVVTEFDAAEPKGDSWTSS